MYNVIVEIKDISQNTNIFEKRDILILYINKILRHFHLVK